MITARRHPARPPHRRGTTATFDDWRYLTVASAGGLVAFALAGLPDRLNLPINLLDAAGLSLFAVTGASKALDFGLGPGQAIILGPSPPSAAARCATS